MAEGIFHLGEDGSLTELRPQGFITEDDFQDLLARHPRLLPGAPAGGGEPWLLIRREAGVPDAADASDRWSLDHLFVDREGVPTLVEVKRSSDTRLRREVVGQMLDYAANAVVYWPADRLSGDFEARCAREGLDPAERLREFLGPDEPAEAFWGRVKTNLQAGRVRMVFVADEVPKELQRVVEFLNEQMDPAEVLAVELRQYVGGGTRSLVPRLVGRTAEAETRKQAPGRQPPVDEAEFLSRLRAKRGDAAAGLAERLIAWGRRRAAGVAFGANSFALKFGGARGVRSVFNCWDYGDFGYWDTSLPTIPPFDDPAAVGSLLSRLNAVPGVIKNPARKSFGILLADAAKADGGDRLVEVLDWFADVVSSSRAT